MGLSFLLYPVTLSSIPSSRMNYPSSTGHFCPLKWWAPSSPQKHIPVVLDLFRKADSSWLLLDPYCFTQEEPVYSLELARNLECLLLPLGGQAAEESRNPASPHKYLGIPDTSLTFRPCSPANVLSHIPVFTQPMQSDRPPLWKGVINISEGTGGDPPHSHDIFLEGQGKDRRSYWTLWSFKLLVTK